MSEHLLIQENALVDGSPFESEDLSRRRLLRDAAALSAIPVITMALRPFGVVGEEQPTQEVNIAEAYKAETEKLSVFASWSSMMSEMGPDGNRHTRIEDGADVPRRAGSVNKLATALAILDCKDKGLIDLRQEVYIPDFAPDPGAERKLKDVETIDSLMSKMIINSSNEAFRALLTVVPGDQINKILWEKGIHSTYLEPSPIPGRYYTGTTTPRAAHDLLLGLTDGSLVSSGSSRHLLNLMLNSTFNLGIRRNMNETERHRVATKYGQLDNSWNEVGIIFKNGPDGQVPHTIYSFFANTLGSAPNLPTVENIVNEFNKLSVLAVHALFGQIMMRRAFGIE